MKKRIITFLLFLVIIFSAFGIANAGVSSGIYGGTTCTVGDTIKVRVEYSGSALGSGKCSVTVENGSILSFQSASSGTVDVSSNNPTFVWEVKDADINSGVSTANFYLSFKAKNAGTTKVYLNTNDLSDINGSTLSGGSDYVTVKVNNPAKSGNNDLASITPSKGELVPSFSSDVTDYTVTVEYADEEVVLGYKVANGGASASISGSNTLAVGNNERTITVTAANGSTKKYNVNVIRAAEDGTLPDGTNLYEIRKLNSLSVFDNEIRYLLMDDITGYSVPSGFELGSVKYNEYDIPVFIAKKTGIKMAYALPVDATEKDENLDEENNGLSNDQTNTEVLTPTSEDKKEFKDGIWVFYDTNGNVFLPAYSLKGEELVDYSHYLLFGDDEEPVEEEPSIFDNELMIFIILGTLALLFIVIVCLQISILSGKRKEKKKAKAKEKLEEKIEDTEKVNEAEATEAQKGFGKVTIEDIENITKEEKTSDESEVSIEENVD